MTIQMELSKRLTHAIKPLPELPPLISFFTGAGFLNLGMIQSGFYILWSLEKDPQVCDAHDYGMKSHFEAQQLRVKPPMITCRDDIQNRSPVRIRREAFGNASYDDFFGIIGGPPCPDFSVAGKNQGYEAERGRLTSTFFKRIYELFPSFFLIENVKGLISTHKHRDFLFREILKLEERGYAVDLTILNAIDLGIPQDRERLFIIGIKSNLLKRLYACNLHIGYRDWFPWPEDSKFNEAKTRFRWPTMVPFGSTPEKPQDIPEELFIEPLIINQNAIEQLPNGKEGFVPHSDKFFQIPEGDVSRKSFKRLHRYRYSPTAAYGNNEVHLHPALPRRLNVREAMRIQSVPDTFALPSEMPLTTKFKVIGNGVPVQLANKVGQSLAGFLMGDNPLLSEI